MEDGSLSGITLIICLIAANGLLTLAHAAISTSPSAYLRDLADDGNRRATRVLRLSDNLPQLHITFQLAVLLLRVAIFAQATIMVKSPLLALPPEVSALVIPPISYAIVLIPLALLVYLLGDLIPGSIGRSRAASIAPVASWPMHALVTLFGPLVRLFLIIESSFSRVAGGGDVARTVTDEEILSLVDVGQRGGAIESEEKNMIRSVLEFGETLVREIMVPRLDVVALEVNSTLNEALDTFVRSGHSRIPVYEEKIDNVRGVLYAKDLLARMRELDDHTIRELMRPPYFVPESKRADVLFREMQLNKIHLAIIVDEYGGTAGIVTIEDLIEEIVGEIQDEYDTDEEAVFVKLDENDYVFDAGINLDDFNDLMDSDLSTEDNDTLGGYIFGLLGRVPEAGETITVEEKAHRLILEVQEVEGRRIRKVHVIRVEKSDDVDTPEGASENGRRENETVDVKPQEGIASRASNSI